MKILTNAFLILAAAGALFAQDGLQVNVSQGPPWTGYTNILTYSGTNLTYVCIAASTQSAQVFTVSAASNASSVSFTYPSGTFDYQSGVTTNPTISITGATAGWAGINGIFTLTPTSATTGTIAVNSTGFGTYSGQTPVFRTRAPLGTAKYWAVQALKYDGSNNLIWTGWASDGTGSNPSGLAGGTPSFRFKCSDKSTLSFE